MDITSQRPLIVIVEPQQIDVQRLRLSDALQLDCQSQDRRRGRSAWWFPSECKDRFVSVKMSSHKSTRERRIDELLNELTAGDTHVVAELGGLGCTMIEVIEIINQLGKRI